MSINTEQIQELLGTGLSNEVVASAVGVDPSYVSQLMADETFASVVIAKRSKALTANSARDLTWDGLEDRLLKKMAQVVDYMVKPEQIMQALKLTNSAVRRGVPHQHQLTNRTQIVPLSLPPVLKRHFTLNPKGEIIDVEDQTLVTMSSVSLLNKLKEDRGGSEGDKYGNLANQISTKEVVSVSLNQGDRKAVRELSSQPIPKPAKELENVSLSDL